MESETSQRDTIVKQVAPMRRIPKIHTSEEGIKSQRSRYMTDANLSGI
jgi:hypothetical protein